MAREWEYYTSSSGRDPVAKELRKLRLTEWEAGRLDDAMEALAEGRGRPGTDFKFLRDGVLEARVDGLNRTFRMFYAEVEDRPALLALHFISKKKQRDSHAIDVAVDRLKDWSRRDRDG